jgi:hypothetical protein
MKKLILFFLLFIPVSLIAQNNIEGDNTFDELKEWMIKISSDSEMRSRMMNMMIEKTKGNEAEMMKLVNSFTVDPELNKMIMDKMPKRASSDNSLQPRGMMRDSVKVIKMERVKPVPKRQ